MSGDIMTSEQPLKDAEPDKEAALIAARIAHILQIYPRISYSMLHIALGPALVANVWRPILDEMIAENVVQVDTVNRASPAGRSQTYSIISLINASAEQ
jgi:hypothetical protein